MSSPGNRSSCLHPQARFRNGSIPGDLIRMVGLRYGKTCIQGQEENTKSPIGEAFTKFPAMVAMLRIGVDETSFYIPVKSQQDLLNEA